MKTEKNPDSGSDFDDDDDPDKTEVPGNLDTTQDFLTIFFFFLIQFPCYLFII